jgi:hypothetical protein
VTVAVTRIRTVARVRLLQEGIHVRPIHLRAKENFVEGAMKNGAQAAKLPVDHTRSSGLDILQNPSIGCHASDRRPPQTTAPRWAAVGGSDRMGSVRSAKTIWTIVNCLRLKICQICTTGVQTVWETCRWLRLITLLAWLATWAITVSLRFSGTPASRVSYACLRSGLRLISFITPSRIRC